MSVRSRRRFVVRRVASLAAAAFLLLGAGASTSRAGSIFLTGHDPDYHSYYCCNLDGARHINQIAIHYILDPTYNPFAANIHKFLYVSSSIFPPPGHIDGRMGLAAAGFVEGVDFEKHDASDLYT